VHTVAQSFSIRPGAAGRASGRRALVAGFAASFAAHAALLGLARWPDLDRGPDPLPVLTATLVSHSVTGPAPVPVAPAIDVGREAPAAPALPLRPAGPEPEAKQDARAAAPSTVRAPAPNRRVPTVPVPRTSTPAGAQAVAPRTAVTAQRLPPVAPDPGSAAPDSAGTPRSARARSPVARAPAAPPVADALPETAAAYLSAPAPRYPLAARREGIEGRVTVRVLVSTRGTPARIDIEQSSGSDILDRAAVEAVSAWRFAPARRGTQPVDAWVLVPVEFHLRDG